MQMYCRCSKREKACTAVTLFERWKLVWFAWPKQTVKKNKKTAGRNIQLIAQSKIAVLKLLLPSNPARPEHCPYLPQMWEGSLGSLGAWLRCEGLQTSLNGIYPPTSGVKLHSLQRSAKNELLNSDAEWRFSYFFSKQTLTVHMTPTLQFRSPLWQEGCAAEQKTAPEPHLLYHHCRTGATEDWPPRSALKMCLVSGSVDPVSRCRHFSQILRF